MTEASFDITVRHVPAEQMVVLGLHGDINALAESQLMGGYTCAVAFDPVRIMLDFTHVEYINSTGIA